jgi:hypothetical protein
VHYSLALSIALFIAPSQFIASSLAIFPWPGSLPLVHWTYLLARALAYTCSSSLALVRATALFTDIHSLVLVHCASHLSQFACPISAVNRAVS